MTNGLEDNYKRLGYAILLQAVKDFYDKNTEAEQWLKSDHCRFYLQQLGLAHYASRMESTLRMIEDCRKRGVRINSRNFQPKDIMLSDDEL